MRRTRSRLAAASGLLALTAVFAWPVRSLSDGLVLVRIDKVQQAMPAPDVVAQMATVQEFEQSWLVRMPESVAGRLQESGILHENFGEVPDGHALFVVSLDAAACAEGTSAGRMAEGSCADLESLKRLGTVWPIDRHGSILATAFEDVRERISSPVHLKRLPHRIDVAPSFRFAGRGVAIRRPATAVGTVPRPVIAQMVTRVSSPALAGTIGALEGFHTRYASLPSCASAGTWLLDAFTGLGVPAERDPFTFAGYATHNIVATLPGRTWPEQVIIVGAHYDSYSNDATRLAPGADDNASGTAVVLELARVLGQYSFDYTIKFVAFSAEEWGLYGSRHYAQSARAAGERIVAVVNLDMVGYVDRAPEDLDLVVNANSEWLANAFAAAAATYAPMPTVKVINASFNRSDHASFWDQGYSALCGIEDAIVTNPYYHKTSDTFSTLDMDFETAVARGSLATVAALAQPYAWPPPPASVTVQGQTVGSFLMRARSAYLTWSAAPGASGHHVYRATASRGPYQRMTPSPITGTSFADRLLGATASYYYVVTSVDAGGNEGNHSTEVVLAGTGRS